MIYLFCGDDTKRKYKVYENFLKESKEGAEVFIVSKNDFDPVQTESLYSGSSLFSEKSLTIFTNIFEENEHLKFILDRLEELQESPNIFIFLEGKLDKIVLDDFKSARAEVNIFELPKVKKERYNSFLLANALGDKNKFMLWFHFRQAIDAGVAMEEMIGILFWKTKDMILKKNFNKFKEEELQNFAGELSYILPKARKEGRDAEASFERFILNAI